jgi:hypothetical protein
VDNELYDSEEKRLAKALMRLHAKVLGLVLGLLFGLGIFIATNWLVLQGGYTDSEGRYIIGSHLGLLSHFFIGYSVSFWGSIIGFFYGFALGTITGATIGFIYNSLTKFRSLIEK